MKRKKNKIIRAIEILAITVACIALLPLFLLVFIFAAGYTLIVEIQQEYRCMGCGKWIPRKKRTDSLNNWCSKDCYYDR